MGDQKRNKPWDFHTCKSCPYRTRVPFFMCQHVRQHFRRWKPDTFKCESHSPELFECEQCLFESDFKIDLQNHINVIHEEKEENVGYKSILKGYKCEYCDFQTHSLLVMLRHIYCFKHKSGQNKIQKKLLNKVKKWFKCEHCVFKTRQLLRLKSHCSVKHTDAQNVWFKCELCTFKTKYQGCLKNHINRKHTDDEKTGNTLYLKMHITQEPEILEDGDWFDNLFRTRQEDSRNCTQRNEGNMNGTRNIRHAKKLNYLSSRKKYFKKKYFCYFCKKLKTNIARHFELSHPKEDVVQKFLALRKGSAERHKLISTIRKKGTFEYRELHKGKLFFSGGSNKPIEPNSLKEDSFQSSKWSSETYEMVSSIRRKEDFEDNKLQEGPILSRNMICKLEEPINPIDNNYLQYSESLEYLKQAKNYPKKQNFCWFCKKLKTNIARHFELSHSKEEEVKKFLMFSKGSIERFEIISDIRKKGNFEYNQVHEREPILPRRTYKSGLRNVKVNCAPCPKCKALYSKNWLHRHYNNCCKGPTHISVD